MSSMRRGAARTPRSGEPRRPADMPRAPAMAPPLPGQGSAAAPCACGGSCPRCRAQQDALAVSRPGDAGEVQARQVADRVARGASVAGLLRAGSASAGIAREAAAASAPSRVGAAVAQSLQASRGGGQPLNPAVGEAMGRQFGSDFSGVRVHADGEAASLSDRLQAKAFTVGRDVYFNRGRYQPDTPQGRHLLAHELAHVVQQGQGGEWVQRDIEDGTDVDGPAAEPGLDEGVADAVEAKGGCDAERNISRLIHNYTDVEFTVPEGCTATLTFSALWVPIGESVDCCTGADTYTVTPLRGRAATLRVGANICGDTDSHPRGTGHMTLRGHQRLRIRVDRGGCEGISMDLQINVKIR